MQFNCQFIRKWRNAIPTFILIVERVLPAKAWVIWSWVHVMLHTTVMYTRYMNIVATQMAEAKEKRVIHLPQFAVICSWIPRPSKEDKRCDQQEITILFWKTLQTRKEKYQQTRPAATKERMSRKLKIWTSISWGMWGEPVKGIENNTLQWLVSVSAKACNNPPKSSKQAAS